MKIPSQTCRILTVNLLVIRGSTAACRGHTESVCVDLMNNIYTNMLHAGEGFGAADTEVGREERAGAVLQQVE